MKDVEGTASVDVKVDVETEPLMVKVCGSSMTLIVPTISYGSDRSEVSRAPNTQGAHDAAGIQ